MTPELGTNGQFAKCWIREEYGIYLIKRGSEGARNAGLEPYCEFYGSRIMKKICKEVVDYDLVHYRGKLATKCPLFTSEKYGFVPMMYMDYGKTMPTLLKYVKQLGFDCEFKNMLVGDTVIMNEDRHLGNFGVLVDNDSFEMVGFAPLFDHNVSLLCYGEKDDLVDPEKYMRKTNKRHKLDTGTFLSLGRKFVSNENKKELIKLIDYEIARHGKYDFEDWRLDALSKQIRKQVKGLLD